MNTPWWQRWPWRPRGGSLQRLILVGLLVPLWALVSLVATVQVVQQVRHNAAAQDAVLHRALTTWPTVLQPQAGASAMEQAPAVWFRESSLDGERLAGSADLPPRWADFKDPIDALGARFRQRMDEARREAANPGISREDVQACIAYGSEMARERFVEIPLPP